MSDLGFGESIPSPEFDKSRVSVDVWTGVHGYERDYDTLAPLLRGHQYDIWVPELAGPTSELQDTFRRIANGDARAYKHSVGWNGPAYAPFVGLLKSLYGSHIEIFFADYTREQLEDDEDIPVISRPAPLESLRDLDATIAYCVDNSQRHARSIEKRDSNIAHNLDVDLPDFINQHAKLRDRNNIRVLTSIGLNHVNLADKIAKVGYKTNTIIPGTSMSPWTEVIHKIQKGEELDRSLLVQVALAAFIGNVLGHTDGLKLDAIMRLITENTSEQDVAALIASYEICGEEVCRIFVDQAAGRLGIVDPDLKLMVDKPPLDLSFILRGI